MHVSVLLALLLFLQTTPATPVGSAAPDAPSDALVFLQSVTQRYSDAKSYHIEATLERTSHNELSRNWQKSFLNAIVAPDNRYHFEGHSGFGSGMRVSDGRRRWDYHVDEHKYTEKEVSGSDSDKGRVITEEEMPVVQAKDLIRNIRMLATRLKSARFLPDEEILIHGETIDCRVIQFSDADFKTHKPDFNTQETVWVDKSRMVVVKTIRQSNTYLIVGGSNDAHIPLETEDTIIFDVVRLDEQEPDSSFFFSPPSDTKLVESFPNPFSRHADIRAADFLGKPAPDIRFKISGKDALLSSYRGKPVFIEFWATWCGPCVELTPDLKQLYSDTASKGLVWLTFDTDEDPSSAETFLKQEHVPWPNYHDEDGTIGKAFGREGIPLGILIDANGKVTFYESGYDVSELRAAIAKLGPEFAGVAPNSTTKQATATNRSRD